MTTSSVSSTSSSSDSEPESSRPSIREQVLAFFGPKSTNNETQRALADHLQAFVAAPSLAERLDAWLRLIHWTRLGTSSSIRLLGIRMGWREAYLYWELFLDVLERVPKVRTRVQETINRVMQETNAVTLFGESGLPCDRGFVVEFADRVIRKILPTLRNDRDLSHLLQRQYRHPVEVQWFSDIPSPLFARIILALTPSSTPEQVKAFRKTFADGFRLLAIRVQGQGMSEKLRARSQNPDEVTLSPFYRLAQLSERLVAEWQQGCDLDALALEWRRELSSCRNEMRWIQHHLETTGVSVDIVYGLDVLQYCLRRMDNMLDIITARDEDQYAMTLHTFLTDLIQASLQDCSASYLAKASTKLLHRKIVDRSGQTGEHYIAQDREEYRHIWLAAAGGGVLTSFTAAFKMLILGLGLAPFLEGFGYGLNYAVSFILLQTFGLMLATKQPAMTAATLATIMRDQRGSARLDRIVDFMTKISHSQIAAAVSNVLVVSLAAYALVWCWRLIVGRRLLDFETAEHVYHTLSPLDSGTVIFAALTGVILWLSSLAGGWIENWAVYHRLPQALAEHRWGSRLGEARLQRLASHISHNIGGWGTNISLGMMLGMTPALGAFFGLPLDVRHVTLSTGTLALASASLDVEWYREGWFLRAIAGVAVMFVLNLGVSFLLSLITALRAYDVQRSEIVELGRRILQRLVNHPRDFILPPRESIPAPDAQATP
jgi:site-specific recombinase